MDSNIFKIIFRTFKIFTEPGPFRPTSKNLEKSVNRLEKDYSYISQTFGFMLLDILEKTGTENDEDPFGKS